MLFDNTYKTISKLSEGIFRDKGSKFIAYAYPISSADQLKDILSDLRNMHSKARHFCWAYRLTPDRGIFRFNDDGEPSGTAGRPILNAMLSADLTNILIVVVRYFGGTLLGVPGLINAYKTAAVEAINAADIVEKQISDIYQIDFNYLEMNDVMRILKEEKINILDQQFDNQCQIIFEVPKAQLNITIPRLEKLNEAALTYKYTS
jgi:uncharacterized YigZ family protein